MNLMNLDECILGIRESLCFVGNLGAVFGMDGAVLALFNITNAVAAPKKWFIFVHLVHRLDKLPYLLLNLMNLMNLDELVYCLRLLFVMGLKAGLNDWLPSGMRSSSKFIWFIGREMWR